MSPTSGGLELGLRLWPRLRLRLLTCCALGTGGLRNQFVAGRFDADVWTELGAKDINSTRHQQIQKEAALQVLSQLILCSAASFSWHRA